ncbi:MAG: xanthine dehydrogenase family protein subunit M [Desulfobacterales bacterium]|nr:xanthine dehydrogenase family protein subunit M [Desulfobacterales bacterium]
MNRLKPFSYFEPASIKEAVEILTEKEEAFPLAGGTDLLVRMKRGDIHPHVLVNLKSIDALRVITIETEKGASIGALTSIADIEKSPVIKTNYPVLAQAAGVLGAPSIRNLATIGGNVGRASPASDMAPALSVLKARVIVEGPKGKRDVGMNEIFTGPGRTTLSKSEIISCFYLPVSPVNTGSAYLKLGRRTGGGDCALVGVAALLTLQNGSPENVRIVLSSVGPKPIRAHTAEALLKNGSLDDHHIKAAARAASEEVNPITDLRCSASYRKKMVSVLTYRALKQSLQRAKGERS